MLTWVTRSGPAEVVLAGDIFDFLQCAEYQGFDMDRSVEIAIHPDSVAVLAGLAAIAQDPQHRIVVLSGNHDPELVLPQVRAALESTLKARVEWADDRPLRPRCGAEPPVWGHSVPCGAGWGWIVHGDRWDPVNFIDRDILGAGAAVTLPPGSRLVHEVLSKITPDHPWVHELKPEFPAVLLLLLYLEPQRTWRYVQDHHGVRKDLLLATIGGGLRAGPLFSPVERPQPDPADLTAWLGAQIGAELDGREQIAEVAEWLEWGPGDGAMVNHASAGRGERWSSESPRTFAVIEEDGTAGLWTWTDQHRAEEVAGV